MSYFEFSLLVFVVIVGRYIVLSGSFYLLVNKWGRKYFQGKKLNPSHKGTKEKEEFFWGVLNSINFVVLGLVCFWLYKNGHSKIYTDVSQYGWTYLIASGFLLFIIQDAYFYWSHRLMHHPKLFYLTGHSIHHRFRNPTAWSAFSVHPVEGYIEVAFRPIIIMLLPLHPSVIVVFLVLSFSLNVIGHCGYELFPSGYTKFPLTKIWSNATHHYLHHKKSHCNYALYFSWWDKMMGTEAKGYHDAFEERARVPFRSQLQPKS